MRHVRVLTAAMATLAAALAVTVHQQAATAAPGCVSSTPFTSGTGGYHTVHIPALVSARGVLVAFAEGRRAGGADNGDIEVVSRRSTDGGCTWGPVRRVADNGYDTVGNPAPVFDPETGRIVLLTVRQSGKVTQADIQAGRVSAAAGRRVYVQTSSDNGVTWTTPREITSATQKSSWRWYATGPGHGIALASGRLVIPADHTGAGLLRGSHLLLSDDHGRTWRIGAVDDHTDGRVNPDETAVAQLPDGRLYLNARDEGGTDPATRAFTYSLTNGSTFSAPFRPIPALVAPVVKGTLLQDTGTSCKPLLFSAPQDPTQRRNLTVRRSTDAGRTWRTELVVTPGPAAYSDLAKLDRTTAGVLYETGTAGPYEQIRFRPFTVGC